MARNSAQPLRKTKDRLIAVIDIGSNSVRMVVYKGLIRLPHILFNERVLCGLGRDVTHKGTMNAEAMALAMTTLLRFAELCRDMAVDHIEAFATAAVRTVQYGVDHSYETLLRFPNGGVPLVLFLLWVAKRPAKN